MHSLAHLTQRPLSVLVDSGSTHNFLQRKYGTQIRGVQSLPEFWVYIGSGEYPVCEQVCRDIPITIQSVTLVEDLFVLAIGWANLVLGI